MKKILGAFVFLIVIMGAGIVVSTPVLDAWVTPSTDPAYVSTNYTHFNATFTLDAGNDTQSVIFNLNGTNTTLVAGNVTNSSVTAFQIEYNSTIGFDDSDGNYTYYYYINITDGTTDGFQLQTDERTVVFDDTNPSGATETFTELNGSSASMTIRYNSTVTELNPDSCYATIYSLNTSVTPTDVYGDFTLESAGTYYCTITLTESDITQRGAFTFEPHYNDSAENAAVGTNETLVVNTLYGDSWNMIAATRNTSTYDIGALTDLITHVSVWDFTNQSHTNYVVGANTNNDTTIEEGYPAYVYVGGTRGTEYYLFRTITTHTAANITNLTSGWNQVSTFNTTGWTLEQLADKTLTKKSAGDQRIDYVSLYDSEDKIYYTHRNDFSIYDSLRLEYGESIWVFVNNTAGNWSTIDLER